MHDTDTLKPRTYTIRLSDEDARWFLQMAYMEGTTPDELLEGFVHDLIDGPLTNGSDEREAARQYVSRCAYDMSREETFLMFLLRSSVYERVIDELDTLQSLRDELDYFHEHPEEAENDAEWIERLNDEKAIFEGRLAESYGEYKNLPEPELPPEEALEELRAYAKQIEDIGREDP